MTDCDTVLLNTSSDIDPTFSAGSDHYDGFCVTDISADFGFEEVETRLGPVSCLDVCAASV